MNLRTLGFGCVFVCLGQTGCGESTDNGQRSLDGWLGESTHLAISGTFEGKVFDVRLEGEAAKDIYCHRFYTPIPGTQPGADGRYDTSKVYFAMKELGGVIDVNGKPTEFTIAYWRHDMAPGSELQVVARNYGTAIPPGQTWSDINLFEPGMDVLSGVESAAASGTVSIKLNTGSPDANGVFVPAGGRTGEFVSVSWGPNDNLKVSATADCTLSLVVPWAAGVIKP